MRKRLRDDPGDHASACVLGALLLGEGRVDEALDLLDARVADRACGDLLREYLVGERRHDEALGLMARRGGGAGPSLLVDRAVTAHLRGEFEDAIRYCDLAIAADASHAPAHNHRGRALFNLRRIDPARAGFLRAVRIAPDYAEAWHNLGHVLREAREIEQAEHAYGHALRLRPAYRSAMLNRGIVRSARGHHAPALQDFRQALLLDPGHAEACINAALCLHLLARHDEARTAYEQAISLAPGDPRAYLQCGRLELEVADPEAALRHFRRALDIDQRSAEAWGDVAIALEALGRLDEVEHALAAGLAIAPIDPGLRLEHANLARHRGETASALAGLRAINPRALRPHQRQRHRQLLDLLERGTANA